MPSRPLAWPRLTPLALTLALSQPLALGGCGHKAVDASPEAVVREFLDRMDRVQGDTKDARGVFDLLSQAAQTNLSDRARRASAATGKRMGPEQMIAPAHFYPRFQPRQWSTRAQGDRALVDVVGVDAENERASVPCILEESHWRVDLVLPAMPPIEHRALPLERRPPAGR